MRKRLLPGLVGAVAGMTALAWSASSGAAQNAQFIRTDAPVIALNHVSVIDGTGAEAMDDRVGRIQPGMQADMIVLAGGLAEDPTVIKNTRIVFRKGIGYDSPAILERLKGRVGR
jgi:cytosine/adenosine deaminase-related metal-dependent hydrolase